MALENLQRLRIDKKRAHPPRKRRWPVIVVCLIFFALGFFAARMFSGVGGQKGTTVKTIVVRTGNGGDMKQFTAGGWIEVATPAYPLHVVARLSERLEEVRVHQGQVVQPGEILARMYDKDTREELTVMQAGLAAAQTNLAKMTKGYRAEDISASNARAAETAAKRALALLKFNRVSNLWQQKIISKEELDSAASIYLQICAADDAAQASSAMMRSGYRSEEVGTAQANADKLKAQVAMAERAVEYCTLRAPEHDRPLRVIKVHRSVGEWINTDKEKAPTIISLYDPSRIQMRVDVSQANIMSVKKDAGVTVVTEANPSRQYKGKVLRIEPLADIAKNTITARVKITDPDEMLFPEMVAQATFLNTAPEEKTEKKMRIPADTIVYDGEAAYVMINDNGTARKRSIRAQQVGSGYAEIAEGLRSGQRVILNPTSVKDGQAVSEE